MVIAYHPALTIWAARVRTIDHPTSFGTTHMIDLGQRTWVDWRSSWVDWRSSWVDWRSSWVDWRALGRLARAGRLAPELGERRGLGHDRVVHGVRQQRVQILLQPR